MEEQAKKVETKKRALHRTSVLEKRSVKLHGIFHSLGYKSKMLSFWYKSIAIDYDCVLKGTGILLDSGKRESYSFEMTKTSKLADVFKVLDGKKINSANIKLSITMRPTADFKAKVGDVCSFYSLEQRSISHLFLEYERLDLPKSVFKFKLLTHYYHNILSSEELDALRKRAKELSSHIAK